MTACSGHEQLHTGGTLSPVPILQRAHTLVNPQSVQDQRNACGCVEEKANPPHLLHGLNHTPSTDLPIVPIVSTAPTPPSFIVTVVSASCLDCTVCPSTSVPACALASTSSTVKPPAHACAI